MPSQDLTEYISSFILGINTGVGEPSGMVAYPECPGPDTNLEKITGFSFNGYYGFKIWLQSID